jgi:hypothetical protein
MKARDIPQLGIVGLLAGLLTAALRMDLLAGAWLGFAIAAYLRAYLDFRPASRLVGFAFIAMLAVFVFQLVSPLLVFSGWNESRDPPVLLSRAIRAGSAEIIVILIACSVLLVPLAQLLRPWSLSATFLLMIVGGIIADLAWRSASTLGMWMWHGLAALRPASPLSPRELLSFGELSFNVVAYAGWAALIATMLWLNRIPVPTRVPPTETKAPPFWPIYVLLSPGLVAVYWGAKQGIEFQRQLTEELPHTVVGWLSAPRKFDQVFVMDYIGGLTPGAPQYQFAFATDGRTQTIEYFVQYKSSATVGPLVSLAVRQYPNAEWASRDLRQVPQFGAIELYPGTIKKRMMFGHVILSCTLLDKPNFYWASGDSTIEIRFEGTGVIDEFLKKYLDRYPSSALPAIYSQIDRLSNGWHDGS